jgi:hypothetical protein
MLRTRINTALHCSGVASELLELVFVSTSKKWNRRIVSGGSSKHLHPPRIPDLNRLLKWDSDLTRHVLAHQHLNMHGAVANSATAPSKHLHPARIPDLIF